VCEMVGDTHTHEHTHTYTYMSIYTYVCIYGDRERVCWREGHLVDYSHEMKQTESYRDN
jgi:hypothetical protein